jgi:hypothetical protein
MGMTTRGALAPWVLSSLLLGACGDDAAGTCPPEYPFLRDGVCYRAGDGSVFGMDAGSSDAGARRDAGAFDAGASREVDSGDVDAGAVECIGTHPIVDGERRFCDPGFCYCLEPGPRDTCFPTATAAACCTVEPECERTR